MTATKGPKAPATSTPTAARRANASLLALLLVGCASGGPADVERPSAPVTTPEATEAAAVFPRSEPLPDGIEVSGLPEELLRGTIAIGRFGQELALETEDEVVIFDLQSMAAVATFALPDVPQINGILLTADSLWVLDHANGRVIRIDRATGEEVATIEIGGKTVSLVETEDGIWAGSAHTFPEAAALIDPASNAVVRRLEVGAFPARGDRTLWFGRDSSGMDGTVREIDPTSGEVRTSIDLDGADGCYVGGSLPAVAWAWCFDPPPDDTQLTRLDMSSGTVASVINLEGGGGLVGVDGDRSWFFSDLGLLVVDNATNEVLAVYAVPPEDPYAIVDGVLWRIDRERGVMLRHDMAG